MSQSSLLWGLLFGSVGTGYFIYGRKQGRPMALLCGVALMVVPSLMPTAVLMVVSGIALSALPYFVSI